MTRAAIAMDGQVISEHFGKTKSFLFVNYEGDHLLSREVIAAPTEEHVPGLFPKWIKEMGADRVVAGGMGSQAKRFFESLGIDVLTVTSMDVEEGVKALLSGGLATVETDCAHDSDCKK